MTLEQILNYVKQLSTADKIKLIERVAAEIEQELIASPHAPRKSLWGLCADLRNTPLPEDIDSSPGAECANFPRENI